MMEQLEHQLLEVQRVAGVVQDKLAEAQSVKTLYNRSASSFQYGRLLDCMMEASERAECLTDRLRRFILRNTFSSSLKEEYCNGVQREHNKKLNNGLPILHKVPPKRDYGRYFCIMAKKGGTSHGGLTEKLSPFFHAQKQEVNAYGR